VRTAFIITAMIPLMMEAVRTSETSVNIYLTTGQYIPEESKLHTRRSENLKSELGKYLLEIFRLINFLINRFILINTLIMNSD
jgi:hypothetical protein